MSALKKQCCSKFQIFILQIPNQINVAFFSCFFATLWLGIWIKFMAREKEITIVSFSWLTANITKDFGFAYRNCNSTQNHPHATPSSQWERKGCLLWGSSGSTSNKSVFRTSLVHALTQLKNITWLWKTVVSPFLLSVQKSNAHLGLKGMYLQIHTCVSKT